MTARIRFMIPEKDWPSIKQHISVIPCYDTCGLVCEDSATHELLGAVLFDQLCATSAQCHICLPSPIRALRACLLEAAAVYVFRALKKEVVVGLTPSGNRKAVAFNHHFGFREIARIHKGFDQTNDTIVYEMRKEHCRWLPPLPAVVDDVELSEVRHCG